MYQCIKVKHSIKELSNRQFYLVVFLDMDNAKVFTVYVPDCGSVPFDVGSYYDLHFKPTYDGLNFLVNEK